MAKKDKNDDEAAGEPEVKLTAVTTLLPDPNDVKHNPNLLVETLRKAPARNHPRARSDAALFLWDLSLNDPDARVKMCTEEFAGACQVALRDGDVVDRSATASLVREASGWAEARPLVAAASGSSSGCATCSTTATSPRAPSARSTTQPPRAKSKAVTRAPRAPGAPTGTRTPPPRAPPPRRRSRADEHVRAAPRGGAGAQER